MTNEIATKIEGNEDKLCAALRASSVYSGAKTESIKLVIRYCNARKLDPMAGLVHIVPMYVKDKETGKSEQRDVVMPGVGLYRVNATRSGRYCGLSDVEYGDMITEKLGSAKLTYPEWAKVSVFKRINDDICEFSSGKIFYIEEYATKGRDDKAPNSMWAKRPRGQLGKCAEAQALRKAFPEENSEPTYEEMVGKVEFDSAVSDDNDNKKDGQQYIDGLLAKKSKPSKPRVDVTPTVDKSTGEVVEEPAEVSEEIFALQVKELTTLIVDKDIPGDIVQEWMEKGNASTINELKPATVKALIKKYKDYKGE